MSLFDLVAQLEVLEMVLFERQAVHKSLAMLNLNQDL